MPTPTYIPLATVTLGSSASSVTFSSIPATFRDLVLVINGSATQSNSLPIRLNSDSGNNYPHVVMRGDGAGPESAAATGSAIFATFNAVLLDTPFLSVTQIMDYSATDKHKMALTRITMTRDSGSFYTAALATRFADTAAVTSIECTQAAGGSYKAGSTLNLYGIAS